ncbi:MAG: MBL fold metallo-hydrolase [Chthoniobacteraceae bacterium]
MPRITKLSKKKAEIIPSQAHQNGKSSSAKPAAGAEKKVGLRPKKGWHKRNFLTQVFIPTLFTKRSKSDGNGVLPSLKDGEIGVTWIGHASFLVQMNGRNLLIDPNWAKWLKVIKRIKQPGLELHDLPQIDLVLVTHAHFDHLDRRTLKEVARDQPIVVPFEVGNLVHDLGFRSVHELHYWESFEFEGLKITLTPCHHWGARMLHDSHRGFGGFIIEAGGRTLFHCGDTAYFEGFREIGERFPVDIALLPIGAYDPPSGREVHMNPEEAVRAFFDLRAQTLVPMHYGTFRLSYEPVDEPPVRLLTNAREHGIEEKVCVMTEGKTVVF